MLERTQFENHIGLINHWIQEYFEDIEKYPVKSRANPGDIKARIPSKPPNHGEKIENIIADLNNIIIPGITHWQHPNYHAYFTANASVESLYGEMVTSAIAAQCMIWETSPSAAELEERMMEWLKQILDLPKHMEGVIQDTASTATLVAILTAREVKTEFKSNWSGIPSNLRVYCSSQTHSSIDKAVAISGIGRNNLIKITTDDQMRLDAVALEKQITQDIKAGFIPCCVISSIGTTSTVAIDPISDISKICKNFKIWHHIDAAFAGSALALPEYRWMMEGIETADSFVFNPHKWLFTNFDCTAYFVKDADLLIKTFEINPEYLHTKTRGLVNDYRDWGIQLGRRFRALKLWFVLRSYGIEGIKQKLRLHISLNRTFSEFIQNHNDMELVTDPILNFTCFRMVIKGIAVDQLNLLNSQLLDNINNTGKVFLTHTKVAEKYSIRAVIGQTYVKKRHLDILIEVVGDEVKKLRHQITL